MSHLDRFFNAYLECAFWSSIDDDGRQIDENYSPEDLTDHARAAQRAECVAFIDANREDLEGIDATQAGHDFWLTRNGHGAGFWDRGLGERGERLSAAARVYGEVYLWADESGAVHAG